VCPVRTSKSRIGTAIAISAAATTKTRNTSTAPASAPEKLGKDHEAQDHAVEHQFQEHQHHQQVAPDDDADQSEGEQHARERQQKGGVIHARFPLSAWAAATPCPRRRMSITALAAISATSSSTAVSAKYTQNCSMKTMAKVPTLKASRRQVHGREGLPAQQAVDQHPQEQQQTRKTGHQQGRKALGEGAVAHVQQHDGVDHEHHHRTDVDQDLEHRDHVHAELGVDRCQRDHGADQGQRHAHRVAQEEHGHRTGQRTQGEHHQEDGLNGHFAPSFGG
jgi:hypothetical protein